MMRVVVSRYQNGGPIEAARAKVGEGVIGALERVRRCLSRNVPMRHGTQEIDSVLACKICNGNDFAFLPEQVIGESRNRAHVNTGADHAAAFAHGTQRQWHKIPVGGKNDGSIERSRRQLRGISRPSRPQGSCKGLARCVAGTSQRIYGATLPSGNLSQQVRRRPEAIQSDVLRASARTKALSRSVRRTIEAPTQRR